jgi:NAD(P)-dependent dehydrogenase (short-subunit alcohol dehydrogenase family)
MELDGRVAVITGAASGMGRATALLFAREGARVVAADLDISGGNETAALAREAGSDAIFMRTDVASASDVERLIGTAIESYGQIDILHNNAGMFLVKFLEDMTEEEWDRILGVNLKSIFLAVKYAVPWMKQRRQGCILNTASTGSFLGQHRTPAYIASKGGVAMLTKTLALDYAAYNIRVNCICPGAVDTPMLRQHFDTSPDPGQAAELEKRLIPMKRFLDPEEIAQAALYLASDRARGVTGTALVVDGGSLAGYVE